MLRCWIVPCFRLGVMLAAVAAPAVALAQDSNTQDRLDRLERDLSMLQRQVYRGAPAMAGGGSGSTSAADVEIRMERLEAQMRDLTGRVEQANNGVEQLRQRLEQVNSDLDVRFSQTGGGPVASAAPPGRPGGGGGGGKFAADASGGGLMPPGTVVPPPSGAGGLTPIFNTLSPPGSGPPRAAAPEPASIDPQAGGGSVNEQFNRAFGYVKQADYGNAEAALKGFVEAHPNDPLAASAQYWLGESYFKEEKYREATSAFADGYKRYPKGPKAAEGLLALGMSLARSDQKKNACVVLGQLDQQFPNASGAVKAHAATEKKRIGCG